MFLTNQEHYAYLDSLIAEKPEAILISSHKVFAGILTDGRDTAEWGDKYSSRTRRFVDSLHEVPLVRMLIGLPKYFSCRGDFQCDHCIEKYIDTAGRILKHAERWPNFEWRFSPHSHLKATIAVFGDKVAGVAGSRNLSDADWADISFELSTDQIKTVYDQYRENWDHAQLLTDDNIAIEMDKQINSIKVPG
jgi:hypothetical protein